MIQLGTRTIVYVLCFAALLVSVAARRHVITRQRTDVPISFITETKKYGKPVTTLEVRGRTFHAKEKFTVTPLSDTDFEGYVTRNVASSLKEGQKVNCLDSHTGKTGKISFLDPKVDMMSGLYKLKIKFEEPLVCKNGKLLVETEVAEKKDIIEVPNDALDTAGKDFFIWKVVDGKAKKEKVELSARSGYSSIVMSGLAAGDILVVSGQSQLEEGDSVRMVDHSGNDYQE